MKKLFLAACVAVVSAFSLNAQGLAFRAEVGGNFSNIDQKFNDKELDLDMLAGLRAGVGVEFAFAPMVYASTGLNYYMGGAQKTEDVVLGLLKTEGEMTIRNHNLSLPLNLGIRAKFGAFAVSAEAGPYLSYTLSAKSIKEITGELKGLAEDYERKTTTDLFENKEKLKRFGAGIGVSVAGEYQNYYLRLGTNFGLTNQSKIEEISFKNNDFYLTLGLRF